MNIPKKFRLSQNTKINICCLIIVSLILFIISIFIDKYTNKFLVRIFQNVLIAVSGLLGVSAVWEFIGKQSFANELLDKFNISQEIKKANLECVYDTFADVDWYNIFNEATTFKGFVSYGYTWRNNNRTYLKTAIDNCTKENFIMVFPNFNERTIIDELNRRYGYDGNDKNVESYIKESVIWFLENGAKVYLFNGTLCTSFYLYNNHCIYPLSKHGTDKASIPVIKFKSNGVLYKHVVDDFNRILNESKEVYLEDDQIVKYCE